MRRRISLLVVFLVLVVTLAVVAVVVADESADESAEETVETVDAVEETMEDSVDAGTGEVGEEGASSECASRLRPKAIEKMLPPIMGERETKPQFSEKCSGSA